MERRQMMIQYTVDKESNQGIAGYYGISDDDRGALIEEVAAYLNEVEADGVKVTKVLKYFMEEKGLDGSFLMFLATVGMRELIKRGDQLNMLRQLSGEEGEEDD